MNAAPAPLILVADDDPMTCLLAEESLREAGFRSYAVQTCRGLRESLIQLQPDGILVAPQLPDGDALETIRGAAVSLPAVVVLTEREVTPSRLETFFHGGAVDFIVKPVVWEWLGLRWRQALRHHGQALANRDLAAQHRCLEELMPLLDGALPLPQLARRALERLLALPWATLRGGGLFAVVGGDGAMVPLARIGLAKEPFRGLDLRQLAERGLVVSLEAEPGATAPVQRPHDLCAAGLARDGRLYGVLMLACEPRCRWQPWQRDFLRTVAALLAGCLVRHGVSGIGI